MSDPDYSMFLKPDPVLEALWMQLQNKEINEVQYNELNSKRTAELMKKAGGIGSIAGGGMGNVMASYSYSGDDPRHAKLFAAQEAMRKALAGKEALTASSTPGMYQRVYYDESGNIDYSKDPRYGKSADPALKGTDRYDPNAPAPLKKFYDASGKELSAADVGKSATGQSFAAAGYDIGFGPGMIAPGVKADTSARDARRAAALAAKEEAEARSSSSARESRVQPDVDPIPLTSSLMPIASVEPRPPAKTAPIDTVLFNDDSISPEIMIDLVFEDIGGHELLSISRNDIINGQRVSYSPIKNLGLIQQTYNPNNLFSLQKTSDKYFANFAIKFDEKVPEEGNGENGVNVYIEEATGDLIIETINMNSDEQVESEIAINGTIYEANFGETVS
jgi:hypothetical protein